MSDRRIAFPSFLAKKPYLSMNSVVLSHKMKDDEEASNFIFTINCGLYHRASVVSSTSKFSSSSFFFTGMVTCGHPWGVKTYLIGVSKDKRSKTLQNTETNQTQA